MEFAAPALHRIIKKQGNKRVSEEAAEYLGEYLEQYATQLAEAAIDNSEGDFSLDETHVKAAKNNHSQLTP